jgi:hypothetical protein
MDESASVKLVASSGKLAVPKAGPRQSREVSGLGWLV